MVLKLYNTLSGKKEEFSLINPEKKELGFYGCGPTVYWYQHIGNLRRYIFEDVLYRVLVFNGFRVNHIINVTDVGHLTSDQDEGEDKMEVSAKKENKSAKEIAQHYFNVFKQDLEKLNFSKPDKWAWATDHIKEQIELVKTLWEKGYTYFTNDGIYFDTSKLDDYGKLANINLEGVEGGKRIDIGEKRNKTDFALWKFSKEPGKRQQEWDPKEIVSGLGENWAIGYPGWHIECSAMSSKYLGEQFEIHTGGMDHIQIHHTNEIAQSESAYGKKPWVKYWLHSGFLNLKEGKLSKSKGGIITLSELIDKGYSPMEFKYLCLTTHYRKPLVFSFENLNSAKNAYKRLKENMLKIKDDGKTNKEYLEKFQEAINDDLNTPEAMQVLWNLIKDENAIGKYQTIKKIEEVFALDLISSQKVGEKIPNEIQNMLKEREKARKEKNFEKADKLRDEIQAEGYKIIDTSSGSKLTKV
ncbi:MAG TPA: cysteine--tRNA ligase [Candidatus Nanoarchaeia archaeon]|nr:cysteine--tRNA ligase [Candidatus Nanoarchaeia archaeon]